jgi:hypothetical protein
VIPGNGFRGNRVVGVPYPVVVSPYGYGGYGYGYAPGYTADYGANGDPNNGGNYAYAQPPTPVVVINQNFQPDTVNPVLRDYSNTPLPEPTLKTYQNSSHPYDDQPSDAPRLADDQPTIFLIAMKDHTILPSIAYWVMSDTLNYVTVDGRMNRVSMDLVDRDFSKQLNDERHVEFKLPPTK